MFTNKDGSNLNFNLYRGGKQFKSKKYNKKYRNTKKYRRQGGSSWFRPKTPESVESASKKCNVECETNAKKLCDVTCKAATIAALDVKNIGLSKEFIDDLTSRIKKLDEKNIQLSKKNAELEQEISIRKSMSR